MRVALIYPPFLIENHAFPPLSLPSLAAVLRTSGHEVWQSDLNIAYYRFLGTAEGLSLLELPTAAILERIAGQEHTLLSEYLRARYIPGILAFQPDIVGISLMTEDQLHATFTLARALKQAAPGVHI